MTAPLHVATLNIRNLNDRWAERQTLIYADMAALQPDVLGLQEVVYPLQQDRLIGASGEGRYREIRAWAGRPEYGNSLLVREPLAPEDAERIDLGLKRSALRVRLRLKESNDVLFAVTHLHHVVADADERDRQAVQLLEWLAAAPLTTATVVVGDFNANPTEPAYRRVSDAGFRSAHLEANGRRASSRRRGTPTVFRRASTTSGSAARSASSTAASHSTGRIRTTRRSSHQTTSA